MGVPVEAASFLRVLRLGVEAGELLESASLLRALTPRVDTWELFELVSLSRVLPRLGVDTGEVFESVSLDDEARVALGVGFGSDKGFSSSSGFSHGFAFPSGSILFPLITEIITLFYTMKPTLIVKNSESFEDKVYYNFTIYLSYTN